MPGKGKIIPNPPKLTMWAFEVSPPCGKITAYCKYHNLPLTTVLVNVLSKAEIKWSKDYRKVPIMKIDDRQVNDSSVILETLESELMGRSELTEAEKKWTKWVNDRFMWAFEVGMFSNSKTAADVLSKSANNPATGWFTGTILKYVAPSMITSTAGKIKKNHGLTDESLSECWKELADGLKEKHPEPFLNGQEPGMGDIEVFGVTQAVKHSKFLATQIAGAAPEVQTWYQAMIEQVYGDDKAEHPKTLADFEP
eukprot:TRINITY_DN66977_c7_g1_i1.p1 TRINITY_DN66977_c7_g1~~TRINITY_DN66977_c7_g1_i1.p1  ORF type:complete len:253 (+),score=24.52 TRINITY_DN66977_c7_g1_i1:47-805(+)